LRKTGDAFAPGGISSFFQICDTTSGGKPIGELERVGSRGGGFVITKGVHTHIEISRAEETEIQVFINKKLAPEAETSRTVAQTILSKSETAWKVTIEHEIDIPIGAGFGTSAGGAIGTALALSKALDLRCTYNQLGRIAHIAEIECKTGLGTVGPIMLGGCIITLEPGGPGIGVIDRLPMNGDYSIVAATVGPTATKRVLSSVQKRREINQWGKQTLDLILEKPSIENFLQRSLEFAEKVGFMTDKTRKLVRKAERAGAVGVAQNMVGEAVHAVAREKDVARLVESFKEEIPKEQVLESRIDFQGARLI
jgi:pantoate kinase